METVPNPSAPSATVRPRKKYFSVDEAQKALPYARRIVTDIVATYDAARVLRERFDALAGSPSRELSVLRDEYDACMDRLNDQVAELHHLGVDIKDFQRGLIDFPAWHGDREVCICWRLGEENIVAWHETDGGFAGRQDIATLK